MRVCCKSVLVITLLVLFAVTTKARENSDKLFDYLQHLYDRHDKNLHEFLLGELNQYVVQFPDGEKTAAAQYLIAKVYQEKGDRPKAVAAFLKTIYLYPNSSWQQESAKEARLIISTEGFFKDKRAKLLPLVDATSTAENSADRYFQYVNLAATFDHSDIYAVVINDARNFLILFPEDTRQDSVLLIIAEIYSRKGEAHEAEASYLRLEYCCTESPLVPQARYSRAVIFSQKLNDHKSAIVILSRVAMEHPQSEYAALATLKMGEIKKEKTRDYAGAIADYRKFIESNSDSAKVVEALWTIAEINTANLKDYNGAIAAYNEIVDKHKTDKRAAMAMEKIGDIYKDKLADYSRAAEQYAKIAEVYPDYEKAPELLLKAGSLGEEKLKDYKRAGDYYAMILDKFPQHKIAGEARKRIEKIKTKAGQ